MPSGGFIFTVHMGPLIVSDHKEAFEFFLSEYSKKGNQEACDFVRISPLMGNETEPVFEQQNYRPAPVHLVNPELTWVLDITQSEDAILKQMKKSTRYEVRRIEKSGIKVKQGNEKEDLDIFWDLHMETVRRHGFVPFARKTTEKELEIFGKNVQIFSSYLDQEFYSSSIILFDKYAAYYHQGSSLPHKLPFSYATLWAGILEAKNRGCAEFNFWGVCEENQKSHPWFGLSKFKRGFGGAERRFVHVHDYPLTWKYWINWGVEKYRKWKRGY
jgi:lipid II:glycine glycyltransferase (peptidoglycan interpeptide bridge formation enzyme)